MPVCSVAGQYTWMSLTSPMEEKSTHLQPGRHSKNHPGLAALSACRCGHRSGDLQIGRGGGHRWKPRRPDRLDQDTSQGGALRYDPPQIGKTTQGSQHTLGFTRWSRGDFSSTGQEHRDGCFPYPSSSGLRLANRKGSS